MKALISIDGDSIAIVQQDASGAVKASVDGAAAVDLGNNPATGKPLEGVPRYVSELATMLTGRQSNTAGQPNPTQSTTGTPGEIAATIRPGDEIPWPAPGQQHNVALEHPLGRGEYPINPPADFKGTGRIKGRAASGDDFAVGFSITQSRGDYSNVQEGGDMNPLLNFDSGEKDGFSNVRAGRKFWLNLDNKAGKPIVLQIIRDA